MTELKLHPATFSFVAQPLGGGADAPTPEPGPTTPVLQQRLLHAINTCKSKPEVLGELAHIIAELAEPVSILYFARDGHRLAERGTELWCNLPGGLPAALHDAMRRSCETACERGSIEITRPDAAHGSTVVAVPVVLRGQPPEALAVLLRLSRRTIDSVLVGLHLAAIHLTLWHVHESLSEEESAAAAAAAILDLVAKIDTAGDLRRACYTVVHELERFTAAKQAAVGLCRDSNSPCKLEAVSGLAQFDRRSELVSALQAALDESVVRGSLTVWPAPAETDRHTTLAHRRLVALSGAACAVSAPLCDAGGRVVGAWLVLGPPELAERTANLTFVRAAAPVVGSALDVARRAERCWLGRLAQSVITHRRSWQLKAAIVAACALAGASALPVRHKIKTDCVLQPVTRRYVAAPFDGTLQLTFVKPGDIVVEGQPLAQMDGREIRWELAGLEADHARARKQRDAHMAAQNTAAAQMDKLEMERLELKMELLRHRADNLQIRSPIAGIVISGDQERSEGASLTVGHPLFEIAPLDQMIVELAVSEPDIAHVQPGMPVAIGLDAYPGRRFSGTIAKIHPRSEIRDHASVFIAEMNLPNVDGVLRPGMNGDARIVGRRRALGWIVLHRPWERLVGSLGW